MSKKAASSNNFTEDTVFYTVVCGLCAQNIRGKVEAANIRQHNGQFRVSFCRILCYSGEILYHVSDSFSSRISSYDVRPIFPYSYSFSNINILRDTTLLIPLYLFHKRC